MAVSPEKKEYLPVEERAEEFPEIPVEVPVTVENKGIVTPVPSQFTAQVTDDKGRPLVSPTNGQSVTITLPADPKALSATSKGTPNEATTWFAAFWLRMFKKAIYFGWRVISGGGRHAT